jgi:hypothetical protein
MDGLTIKQNGMKVKEAAAYLGLSWHTLNDWRTKTGCKHQGPVYHRFGRAIVYYVEDLEAYKQQTTQKPVAVVKR